MTARVSSPAFVGRQRELDRAAAALARMRHGDPAVLLVAGEAGIGKSRLVHELTSRAVDTGVRVLEGGCVQIGSESLPFGPFVEALRGLFDGLDETEMAALLGTGRWELSRLVPDLLQTTPEIASAEYGNGTGQGRLFEHVLLLLGRLAGRAPLILVLEDLHWADRSTLALLAFLVRNLRIGRIALIASYRSDELHQLHPLVALLAELERAGRAERIELSPFDDGEIACQLEGILGFQPGRELIESVAARSQGNAFYAEELVAARDLESRLPDTLRDVLLARLAALSEPTREFVRVAAAGGARVSPAVIGHVTGMPEPVLDAAIREAVARHVLIPRDSSLGDSYAFRHALVQEAMYADLLPRERARLHSAFAALLAGEGQTGADASQVAEIAYHWQAAGDEPRAFDAWIQAGIAAEAIYALSDAGSHFERAIELWDRIPDAPSRASLDRIELHARAAAALEATASFRSVAHVRAALDLIDQTAEPTRAALLHARLGDSATMLDDTDAALAAYREAVRLAPSEPPSAARAQVLTELGRCLFFTNQHAESVLLCEEAVRVARAAGSRKAESWALIPLAHNLVVRGAVQTGLANARRARELAADIGDIFGVARALTNAAEMLIVAGIYEEAVKTALEADAYAARYGLSARFSSSNLLWAGLGLIEVGRWDEAADALVRSQSGGGVHDSGDNDLLRLEARRGDFESARRRAEHLRFNIYTQFYEGFRASAALAELALWQGDPRGAREAIRLLTRDLDARPRFSAIEVGAACSLGLRAEADLAVLARRHRSDVRLVAALANGSALLTRMRECSKEVASEHPYYLAQSEAWLATCEGEWSRLAGHSDPERWASAAAAWDSLGLPFGRAYALMREGEAALTGPRDRQHAARVLVDARETAIRLRAEPLRTMIDTLAGRSGTRLVDPQGDHLSPREREVITLVAAGRSNSEIGEALFISKKTASVHVANIKAKLGAQSRIEVANHAIASGMVATASVRVRISHRPG